MKKFLSLLLALLMLASMLVACGGGETPETPDDETPGETPETPDTPEEPEQPEQPEQPEEPETPTEPEQPEEPETPVEPEQPEEPETPVEPEQPEQPEQPETPAEPEQPADGKLVLFSGDDLPAGMKLVELNTDAAYVYEGTGTLKSLEHPDRIRYDFEPVDISGYTNGFFRMLVYVTDVSQVTGGYVELSSSGTFDQNEISWPVTDFIKQNGWNELWLPMYTNRKAGGDIDLTAVNFFRMFINVPADVTEVAPIYVDTCYFTNEYIPTKLEDSTVIEDEIYMLLDGESMPAGLNNVQQSAAQAKSGSGSLLSPSSQVRMMYSFAPLDVSAFKGKYLHMWIYVDNTDLPFSGQIELTSGGNSDVGEWSWNPNAYITQAGWNEVWLPLTTEGEGAARITGGAIDLSAVNFMRVYTNATNGAYPADMYFDDIYFAMTKPE